MDREKEFNRLYALFDKIGQDLDELKERQKSRDEYFAKREEHWAKMDERQKRMDERLGNLGVNIGHRAEDYFFYTLEETKTFGGVHYDGIQRNMAGSIGNVRDEFDIVLYNGDSVAIIETKHKAHPKDVEQLISRKLHNFKKLFPVYGGYKVYLGIATEALSEEVKTKSIENGIGLLVPKGDVIEILDDQLKAY